MNNYISINSNIPSKRCRQFTPNGECKNSRIPCQYFGDGYQRIFCNNKHQVVELSSETFVAKMEEAVLSGGK